MHRTKPRQCGDGEFAGIVMMLVLLLLIYFIAPAACTSPATTHRILEQQGYTNIKTTGYKWFKCGDDGFSTGFEATNPQGKRVSGVVCGGWMKADTVRLD